MSTNQTGIMYIELKSGHGDRGPARIGRVAFSKAGRTLYYRNRKLQVAKGGGIQGNYFDVHTGDEYWVSGPKRDGCDRHWAGGGAVHIDEDVAAEYWRDIRKCTPPTNPLIQWFLRPKKGAN